MKKLLSLLTAMTLVASSSSALVACKVDGADNVIPPSQAEIQAFQKQLDLIWKTVYGKNTDKFVRKIDREQGDQSNYQLFNLNYLQEHFGGDEQNNVDFDLTNDQTSQKMFINDLNTLFNYQDFVDEINSKIATGSNAITFRNIYTGTPETTLGDFKIKLDEGLKLTRVNYQLDDGSIEQLFAIKTSVYRDMYYNDLNGITTLYKTIATPLTVWVGKDGPTLSFAEKITRELPKRLFNSMQTQFKSDVFKTKNSAFKTYGDELDINIADQMNNTDFQTVISNIIDEIDDDQGKYQINYGDKLVDSQFIDQKSDMLLSEQQATIVAKPMFDAVRNPLINSLILATNSEEVGAIPAETDYLSTTDALSMLGEVVDLTDEVATYDATLKVFLEENFAEEAQIPNIIDTSYAYGVLQLNNLILKIGTDSELQLPVIMIPWTFADNSVETYNKSQAFLSSIYDALKLANQKVARAGYGAEPISNFNDDDPSTSALLTTPLFTPDEFEKTNMTQTIEDRSKISSGVHTNINDKVGVVDIFNITQLEDNTQLFNIDLTNGTGNSALINEPVYDYQDFSANLEVVIGQDNRKASPTYAQQLNGTAVLNSSGAIGTRTVSWLRTTEVTDSNNHIAIMNNNNISYNLQIGPITFKILLPFDNGQLYDQLVTSDQVWQGQAYFDMSKNKDLFNTNNSFDWNATNPYLNSDYLNNNRLFYLGTSSYINKGSFGWRAFQAKIRADLNAQPKFANAQEAANWVNKQNYNDTEFPGLSSYYAKAGTFTSVWVQLAFKEGWSGDDHFTVSY